MKEKIVNRFQYANKPRIVFDSNNSKSVSRTQQHFKNEVNINSIMKRAKKTGMVSNPLMANVSRVAKYGDYSNVVDYHTLQNKLCEVNEDFMRLPAELRKRFNHNPQELYDFIADEKNLQESVDLGLLDKSFLPKDVEVPFEPASAEAPASGGEAT